MLNIELWYTCHRTVCNENFKNERPSRKINVAEAGTILSIRTNSLLGNVTF